MRVGAGDFTYQLVESWGRLPQGWSFGSVPDGAVGPDGTVYLFTRGAHPVLVFDSDGNLKGTWGEGVFTNAHGFDIAPDGTVYCCDDKDHTVRQCTLDGKVLRTWGTKGKPSDTGYDGKDYHTIKRAGPPFNRPTTVAFAPTGEFYVSDGYGNSRVHKYSPSGELLFSWGEPGTGPGQFSIVHTVLVAGNGTVYVSDRQNHRIQLFTPDGKYITEWTGLHRPNGMFLGPDGNLYITELALAATAQRAAVAPEITIFTPEGKLLARFGGGERPTMKLYAPHGMWGDPEGNLYVTELTASSEWGALPPDHPLVHKLIRVR